MLLTIPARLLGQNTINTARQLSSTDDTSFIASNTNNWLRFTADSTEEHVLIGANNATTIAHYYLVDSTSSGLHIIDSSLETANYQLSVFTPTNDIEVQYKPLLSILYRFYTDTLTVQDSSIIRKLATLCPFIYGEVVYMARVVYPIVFDENKHFEDDCITIPLIFLNLILQVMIR